MKKNMKSLLTAICFFGLATLSTVANSQTPENRGAVQRTKSSDAQVTSVQLKRGMDFTRANLRTSASAPKIQEITLGGTDFSMTGRQRCFEIYGRCGSYYIWVSGGSGQAAYEMALSYYNIVLCY